MSYEPQPPLHPATVMSFFRNNPELRLSPIQLAECLGQRDVSEIADIRIGCDEKIGFSETTHWASLRASNTGQRIATPSVRGCLPEVVIASR
jgi:hypothetical protein